MTFRHNDDGPRFKVGDRVAFWAMGQLVVGNIRVIYVDRSCLVDVDGVLKPSLRVLPAAVPLIAPASALTYAIEIGP